MFILEGGLEKADAVLADLIPGSQGFKALHLDHDSQRWRYSLHLDPSQTRELQARVGTDPDTMKLFVQVHPTSCY